jgi:hypothetical protein
MFKSLAPFFIAVAAFVGVTACQSEEDTHARNAEIAGLPGLKVTIAGVDLGHDKVQAIAKHLEGKAVDTGAALVRMKKDDQGAATLEIELFAKTLPAGDGLAAELKAAFPELAGATISTGTAQPGGSEPLPLVEVSKELSPAEAQQEIVEQLKAQGVDGEIKVEVKDDGEERRIEVKVEKQKVVEP